MSPVRLRGRLAASHAVLALVLVAVAGVLLITSLRSARLSEDRAGVARDAEVLASRAGRILDEPDALAQLVGDEARARRAVEVRAADGRLVAGAPVTSRDGSVRASAAIPGGGEVVLGEPAPGAGFALSGALIGVAALAIVLAAVAGWWLAGRLSRPIAELTDAARDLALGEPAVVDTSPTVPEVATLAAAFARVAERVQLLTTAQGDRSEQTRAALRRFSHQLGTPLSVLRLRLDDVADPDLTAERRVLLTDVIERQVDALEELGARLKDTTLGADGVDLVRLDLAATASRTVAHLAPLAGWSGVDLRLIPGARPDVMAAPDMLDDAVANVVGNAIKFTPRGGRVTLTVGIDGGAATVDVGDTGPGFAPGERDLVVRPSVRGAASVAAGGTGLGLSLVADAMDRMGGRLELRDRPGGGALVRLVLPLAPPSVDPAPPALAPADVL